MFVGGGYRVSSGLYIELDLTLPICFMCFIHEREKQRQHGSLQPTEGWNADFNLLLGPCVKRHTLSGSGHQNCGKT